VTKGKYYNVTETRISGDYEEELTVFSKNLAGNNTVH